MEQSTLMKKKYLSLPKGDELPIKVGLTGGSGPARARGT